MSKLEKTLWSIAGVILATSTFIVQSGDTLAFLKLPSWVFSGAVAAGAFIRFMYLRLKGKKIKEDKPNDSQ